MNWFLKLFKSPEPIVEKDPNDLKLTKGNSTPWWHVKFCPICKSPVGHEEIITDICLKCGSHHKDMGEVRAVRKIFYQGKWNYQRRYKDGKNEIFPA